MDSSNLPAFIVDEEANSSKFKELISTLPKEKRWNDLTDLYQYEGFWYPFLVLKAVISVQENIQSCPSDIFLCSAPKSGCTWLKALCYAIITRDRFDIEKNNPLLTNISHDLIPFLEGDLSKYPDHQLIATHLPFHALPNSIKSLDRGTKIIYLCREPKDTFISLWYFTIQKMMMATTSATEFTTSFDREFDLFCEGKTIWGPYWDHVLGYWKKNVEMPESILFLKYEELTKDTLLYVRKIAEFMGKPFSRDEEGQGVPQKIVKLCSFENLSNLEVIKSGKHLHHPLQIDNKAYFRKGKPGDWKNHLTSNMIQRIDNITKEKLRGTSLYFGASSTTN